MEEIALSYVSHGKETGEACHLGSVEVLTKENSDLVRI